MKAFATLALVCLAAAADPTAIDVAYLRGNMPFSANECVGGAIKNRASDLEHLECVAPLPVLIQSRLTDIAITAPDAGRSVIPTTVSTNAGAIFVANLTLSPGESKTVIIVSPTILESYLSTTTNGYPGGSLQYCMVDGLAPNPASLQEYELVARAAMDPVPVLGKACLGARRTNTSGVKLTGITSQSTPIPANWQSGNCDASFGSKYSYRFCELALGTESKRGLASDETDPAEPGYGGDNTLLFQQCLDITKCADAGLSEFPFRGVNAPATRAVGPTVVPTAPVTTAFTFTCDSPSVSTAIFTHVTPLEVSPPSGTLIAGPSSSIAFQITCRPSSTLVACCDTPCCSGVCAQIRNSGAISNDAVCEETCSDKACGAITRADTTTTGQTGTLIVKTFGSEAQNAVFDCEDLLTIAGVSSCTDGSETFETETTEGFSVCGECDAPNPDDAPKCPQPHDDDLWTAACFCRACDPTQPLTRRIAGGVPPPVQNVLQVQNCTDDACCEEVFKQAACNGFQLDVCRCARAGGGLVEIECPDCDDESKKGLLGLLGLLGLIPLLLCLCASVLLLCCLIRRRKTEADVHFATFDPHAMPVTAPATATFCALPTTPTATCGVATAPVGFPSVLP